MVFLDFYKMFACFFLLVRRQLGSKIFFAHTDIFIVGFCSFNCTSEIYSIWNIGQLNFLGHSLGFFHEQSRYDRDKYVRIDTINIHSAFYNQFTKQQPDMLQTFEVEYDIGRYFFEEVYAIYSVETFSFFLKHGNFHFWSALGYFISNKDFSNMKKCDRFFSHVWKEWTRYCKTRVNHRKTHKLFRGLLIIVSRSRISYVPTWFLSIFTANFDLEWTSIF